MNWKTFFAGVGSGLAAGLYIRSVIAKHQTISSEKALSIAKTAFKKHGPIQGSWIQMEKQPFKKSLFDYEVYMGGISRNINGNPEQYEFIIDANTGAILDAYLLN